MDSRCNANLAAAACWAAEVTARVVAAAASRLFTVVDGPAVTGKWAFLLRSFTTRPLVRIAALRFLSLIS